jgi:hypothetical protein
MKRTFVALVVGFIFLVPVTGWSAQPGGTLPEQVASLAAQVADEVAARQAALIPIHPRMGMAFNELYGQVAQAGCGWLQLESKKGDMFVYHVALSNPGCNPKIFYYFQDDQIVKIE